MRILTYSINFSPELTGIGKYTGEMAKWLASRGHEVRVVTAPPHYPQWRVFPGYSSWRYRRETIAKYGEGSLEVLRCPVWVPDSPRAWKRILHLASFSVSSLPVLAKQLFWRPEVVLLIAPPFFCSPQTLCLARLSGALAWLHVQDFEVDAAFQLKDFSGSGLRRAVHFLEGRLMRNFDRASAISDRMVQRLSEKGVDRARTMVFPNWVDGETIRPLGTPNVLRSELGIPDSTIVALYSGSIGKKQGLDLLFHACQRLTTRTDIRFVFCVEGPGRDRFVHLAEQSPNVTVLPLQSTERLNELLNLADIHLLPQLADAADLVMPSKLTGMMASGRAVLATAHQGTQLAAVLEGRGLITPPGDVDAMVASLVQLAEDANLRRRLGSEAREYALLHMDRDSILTKFELSILLARGYSQPIRLELPLRPRADALGTLVMAPREGGED